MDDFEKITNLVREGYNRAAVRHQDELDLSRTEMWIYKDFKGKLIGNVVELGFGNGRPIAEDLLNDGCDYLGIDISEKQVELARSYFPQHKERFIQSEMLEFCREQKDNSIGGVVSMFAIFHLPRKYHLELFVELLRILKPSAPLLFTCHPSNWEGTEKEWLEAPEMFWSNFSNRWYQLTLTELGFTFVSSYRKVTKFNGLDEIQYFLLFTK